ncbi:MAG: hypothetical protein R8P61_27005 [Bacteroidia bacterium]|nr:hypothetical protein [Bacteroidia bacterium]
MSDYTPHIDTEVVNLELMERYLEGSLSEEERKEMEENLANDPILADAMEGLSLIEDKEAMKVALGRITEGSQTKLNKYIKKRDQLSKRRSRVEHNNFRFTNYYVAAAAAVAVLISTVWVIRMSEPAQESSSLADANTVEETQVQAPNNPDVIIAPPLSAGEEKEAKEEEAQDEKIVVFDANNSPQFNARVEDAPASSILRDANTATATPPPSADDFIVENPVELRNKDDEENDLGASASEIAKEEVLAKGRSKQEESLEIEAAKPINKSEIAEAKESLLKDEEKLKVLSEEELSSIPLEEKAIDTEAFNEGREQKANAAPRKKRLDDNGPEFPEQSEEDRVFGKISKGQHLADLMLEAVKLYESAQFDKSLVYLKEVMQSSPEHPAANYYAGSIYRNFSQMKTATDYLKEAIKHIDSPTYEYAQWELALVYLARRKSSAAKKLLMKIATAGGKFSNQARSELNKLSGE